MKLNIAVLAVLSGLPNAMYAFTSIPGVMTATRRSAAVPASKASANESSKRNVGTCFVTAALVASIAFGMGEMPASAAESAPPGTTPFNSICLGFGCGGFRGLDYGGAAAPTDEESISFATFLESLDKGLVQKVEFLDGGDKAYAFLVPADKAGGEATRIRVGEGYPEEKGNAWSSPLWVVRTLNDHHVPYKFNYELGPSRAAPTVSK